ncbi:MAG: DUF2807 domain-containing protein [Bacteroidota bacterium]
MKTSFFTLLIITAAFLISCEEDTIVGSGNIVSESRSVSSFDQVEAGAAFDIFISQGTDESLTVEADDNIIDLISTEVVNGSLRIRFTESNLMFSRETMKINMVIPELSALDLEDASTCEVDNFQINGRLDIDLKDGSDVRISGSSAELFARLDDASKIKGFSFTVDDCSAILKDASKMEITVNTSLTGSAKDAAELLYKGNPSISFSTEDAAKLIDAN